MSDFVSSLPWRLAALAALVVGGLSAANGIDAWIDLERAGFGFAAFWVIGSIARSVLRATDTCDRSRPDRASRPSALGDRGAQR